MARLNVNVPMLFEMWHSPMTNAELCHKIGVARSTLVTLRLRYKLPRRPRETKTPDGCVVSDPTPEQIAERAAEVRAGWPEGEAEKRLVGLGRRSWRPPAYNFDGRGCAFVQASR